MFFCGKLKVNSSCVYSAFGVMVEKYDESHYAQHAHKLLVCSISYKHSVDFVVSFVIRDILLY